MRRGNIVIPLVTLLLLATVATGTWVFSSGRKTPLVREESVAGSSTELPILSPTLSEATPSGEISLTPVPSEVIPSLLTPTPIQINLNREEN